MMTSSNGDIFRVTGHLYGEFTGPRWIPRTKAGDTMLWCFLWSASEKNVWVNNSEAGDLGRYQAHYDVTVMYGIIMRKHMKNEISLTLADDLAPSAANPSRAQARILYDNGV